MRAFVAKLRALLRKPGALTRIAPGFVAIVSAIVAMIAVERVALLTSAERFVEDWQIASLTPAEPQDPDIVIAAITEDTLAQFPYRSPVDRDFVANLLTTLAARSPRAIGLDLFFDQPTEASKDDKLRQVLRTLKVPLIVSYTEAPAIVNAEQSAYLRDFLPPRLRGLATVAADQTDTVRWIYPGDVGKDGRYIPSFARGLAEKLGKETPAEQVTLAWHGQPDTGTPAFKQYPAHLISVLPTEWFKDKIVLIGTDITLADRHRTPFATVFQNTEGMLPGIVIQAHSLSQLLHGRTAPDAGWMINLLVASLVAAAGAALGGIVLPLLVRALAALLAALILWAAAAALFHFGGVMIGVIAPTLALALAFWAMEALTGREARRQREFIQGAFSRYVSPKVVDELIRDPAKLSLEGERRLMTYLFTDVANFTTMSEGVEAKELARVLNAYLYGLTGIVLKHGGMVDKFIGDSVFAIFNAPVDQPDHADRAVQCALDIDDFAENYHNEQVKAGVPFGITRIGVHTGLAVIGNFGSSVRFEYTAQGDAVNTASRLEGLNKLLGTRICVSDATRILCESHSFRPVASVILKGKTAAVDVWEPLRAGALDAGFLARYGDAFAHMAARDPDALALFSALSEENAHDPCVSLHMERLRKGAQGVVLVMTEK